MATKSQMLNVTMGFNADTSKAKAQLQDLQNQLSALYNTTKGKGSFNLTEDLNDSIKGVALLKAQLQDATNVKTGKLDLSKFNQSLKDSGMSLEKYRDMFSTMGTAGDKAFASLTTSITNAEIPLKKTNKLVDDLWTTLKNTAKWQISSSIMHGFMGAIQTAYYYAQDLNSSLNDIRIVTGYNTDQMAKFAEQANKAAKSLSTTTTDYTNASLIYYQQGLPEDEIAERTEVTIKMANAAGVSAQVVSDQMTAVWNNFADGSKSLEYYADVMTALGAATASSTDEIAAGLEKFAAVSETIGLSYEYAAASLATITAETRQSADVVGNALKTLFSRIQGLSLGETLEDGTDLNKYSAALDKVGISIKDAAGNVKDMDTILDELGNRWGELAKDEQLAVAQTVAGVRQYTQLVALMDNWETFKANVNIAENSTGTVDQQASIYAESWEAAEKRVQAAAEGIYDSLLNDDFFIEITNGFADFLSGVENVVDALGGMDGVLLLLGSVVGKVFNNQISQGIKNTIYNFKSLTKTGTKELRQLQTEANNLLVKEMLDGSQGPKSNQAKAMKELSRAQQEYLDAAPRMNEIQRTQANMFMDKQKALMEEISLLEEEGKQIEKNHNKLVQSLTSKEKTAGLMQNNKGQYVGTSGAYSQDSKTTYVHLAKVAGEYHGILTKIEHGYQKINKTNFNDVLKEFEKITNEGQELEKVWGSDIAESFYKFKDLLKGFGEGSISVDQINEAFQDLYASMTNIDGAEKLKESLNEITDPALRERLSAIIDSFYSLGVAHGEVSGKTQGLTTYTDKLIKSLQELKNQSYTAVDGFVALGSAMGAIASTVQTFKGLKDIWSNEDTSTLDKILTTVTTLSMVLPNLMNNFKPNDVTKILTLFGALHTKIKGVGNVAQPAAEAAGKMAGALIKTGEAAGEGTKSVGLLGKTVGTTGATVGAALGTMAAFAAIIGAVTVAIIALVKHYKRFETNAKDAAEAAENLTNAARDTKNSLDDIKSSFDAYDTAVEALNECTRGTDEWNQKLKEVNDSVLSLLDAYPELMQYADLFTRNSETGLLEINEAVRQDAISGLEQQAVNLQASSYFAQGQSTIARTQADAVDLGRDIGVQKGISDRGDSAYINMGKIISENYKELGNLTQDEFIATLKELVVKPANMIDSEYDRIIQSMTKYQTRINELANSTEKAKNQMDNAAQLTIAENFDLKGADSAVAENTLQSYRDQFYNEIMKLDSNLNNYDNNSALTINGQNYSLEDVWSLYEQYGGEKGELKENGLRGWTNERKFVYSDENGEKQEVKIEEIANTIAASMALEALGVNAENATAALRAITDTTEGSDFKNFIATQDFSTMSASDLEQYSGEEGANAYFEAIGGNKFTQEQLEAFGFDSAQDLIDAIQIGLEAQKDKLNNSGENLVVTVKKSFDKLLNDKNLLEDLNTKEFEQIGDLLTDVFVDSGTEGLNTVQEAFTKLGDDADEFLGVIEEVDWNTIDLESLKASLESAGVETDGLDGALQILIDSMNKTEEATLSLADAQGKHAGFQELGDLEMGDTISQEQMQSMIDVNPALVQYFQLMGDGTYALVEKAEYFQGIIEDLSFKPLTDQLEYMQGQYEAMKTASEYDYSRINNIGAFGSSQQMDVSTDIDFLKASGTQSADQIKDWEARNAEKSLTGDDYAQIYSALKDCEQATIDWDEKMQELSNQMGEINEAINFTAYKDHVEDLGLDFGATERYAQDLAEAMKESGQEYDNLEEAARSMAIANQRLDRGLSNLASNLDDYNEKLSDSNRYSTEYTEALQDLKTDIADIFNADASLLGDGFIEEQLVGDPEKLRQIADGNMEVINAMRGKVAEEMVVNLKTQVNTDEMDTFLTSYNALKEVFAYEDLSVGVSMMGEDVFIENLNNLISSANMTRDQVNALLGSMGMSAELKTTYKEQMVDVPIYTTQTREIGRSGTTSTIIIDGEPQQWENSYPITETFTYQSGTASMKGSVPVTAIETIANDGTSSGGGIDILTKSEGASAPSTSRSSAPTISPSKSNVYDPTTGKGGYTGNKKSSGGGGGKKDSKTSELKKLDDEIDRYYDINNTLEKISRQLKKIQNQSDTLYGASKIAAMEHEVEVLREQEEAYKAKAAAAREYIDTDRNAFAELGYSVSYDSDGNIANYNELMSQAVADLNNYKNQYNAMSADQQEAFEPVLKSAEDRYESLKDAMSKYEETLQTFRDAEDAAEEARLQRLAKNYEILAHELEYKLYNIEARMKEIDYYVNKLSDDFYSMGEALAILSGKTNEYFNTLEQYGNFVNKLDAQYAAGEITQADYIEGLKDSYDSILDNLEALQELDKEMLEYYGKTLDMAQKELEKYTDQIDHLNDVLDHYQNIMKLIGKETNFDQMGALLEGQAKIRKDSMEIAKANYEMLKREKDDILNSLKSVEEGSAIWDVYKKELEDITKLLIEAEDEMLTRTEEWAESMKAVLENDLAKAYQNLENAFTNGLGFDYLNSSVDRVREQYDLLLTETNKIYETNKIMNSAQSKADQATSKISKQKLKNFIDETQALQDKTNLSKIELEIQQAKYDLLLAEIALEEAQNAKSRVRLQRDAEGNFNYVYTSDAEAISNAEQELADKENALYNIRLEAANAAGEQMLATAEAWADALYQVDLDYMNGVITSEEEWRRRRAEINDQYNKIMMLYQDNYNAATWEDSRIVAESWCNEDDGAYPLIIRKGSEWKSATTDYISEVDGAFTQWESVVNEMTDLVGEDLNETTEKVEELTDASNALKEEVIGEVLPAIESELTTVRDLTSAYAAQRSEIMGLISQYESLATSIREAIQAQSELSNYTPPSSPDLSGLTTGGDWTPADPATPDKDGGGGGGGSPGYDDRLEKPADSEKRYKISAIFNNGAAISGAGYKSESSARSRINQEGNKNKGVKSSSIIAYLGKKNEMEFFQYTKLGTQTNTTTSYSNSLIDQSANNILGLDTGGYTGVWGPEGKLAALHEKELVLNKSDTENMLSAIEIVRDINNQIENSAKYFGGIGANIHLPSMSDMSQILEQTVHIDANFPGVKDRFEIEQAFENIVNMASQFANRKKL